MGEDVSKLRKIETEGIRKLGYFVEVKGDEIIISDGFGDEPVGVKRKKDGWIAWNRRNGVIISEGKRRADCLLDVYGYLLGLEGGD